MRQSIKRNIKVVLLVGLILLLQTAVIYAGGINESKIVTGTQQLIKDLGVVLAAIVTIGAAVWAGYYEMMHRKADDIGEQTKWKNARNGVGVGYVLILSMSSTFATIAYYYV